MPVADAFQAELIALIPNMRGYARSLCLGRQAQADDLAQEALAKAWAARSSFQPGTNLKAWVFMILRNQFISQRRRAWRDLLLDSDVAERTLSQSAYGAVGLELEDVRRALAMLPEPQRDAIILVSVGDLPYEDAAQVLGVKVGTVKSRVSRGREALGAILTEADLKPAAGDPSLALASLLAQAQSARQRAKTRAA